MLHDRGLGHMQRRLYGCGRRRRRDDDRLDLDGRRWRRLDCRRCGGDRRRIGCGLCGLDETRRRQHRGGRLRRLGALDRLAALDRRCRARRETNSRATTSSIVLDALFTSMPWSRFSSAITSWLDVLRSSATL
jgi:hypothetical protein